MDKRTFIVRQRPLIVKATELDIGDYLIEDKFGQQHICSKSDFEKKFDVLTSEEIRMYNCINEVYK
jgi:hypothetical protein